MSRRVAPFVVLLPVLVAVLAIVFVGDGEREAEPTDQIPTGTGSARAEELAAQLPRDDAALVVFEADSGRLSAVELRDLRDLAAQVGVPEEQDAGLVVAPDGTVAIAPVPLGSSDAEEQTEEVTALREELSQATPDGVTSAVTGPAAVQADIDAVFDGANTRLLGATALIVALLLVITYRSPVLWVVPLLVIGIADRLASVAATQLMAALGVAFDDSTTAILSILVFGAGTDYALLLISRYRADLVHHETRYAAMAVALRRTAEAVASSAATVVVGVLTLVLSLTPGTRALGVASAVGIAVAALFVLVVLPAALVCCGRWVFWPRVPRHDPRAPVDVDPRRTLWGRVGRLVSRRPRSVVAGSVAVVAILASGTLGISLGLDGAEGFTDPPEAVLAAERLADSFPAGLSDPVQVVTREDPASVLPAVRGVEGVESARVVARGGGVGLVEAVLSTEPGSAETKDAVLALRAALDGTDTAVGGTEALALDRADATRRDLLVIVPALVLLVLLVLAALLRSLVAPVVLVATVVATYAASLGASWWVFTGLLGFEGLDTNVPIIAFVFLVALGVDYNIFLVVRAREEAATHGSRDGMLRALAVTGGVITSAGILLAAVFTVLGQLPAVGLAEIGVVICLGVLLDTLLVRTVLVPAVAVLLGDRFWWPRSVGPASSSANLAHHPSAPRAEDPVA